MLAADGYRKDEPDFRTVAGALRLELGEREKAEQDLRAALGKNKEHLEARTRLGLLLIRAGKRVEGRAHLSKIIDYYSALSRAEAKKVPPTEYVWMGRACAGLDRIREAYDVMYGQALELDGKCVEANLACGQIFTDKYSFPDARKYFKDVLAVNSHLAEAHIGLARHIRLMSCRSSGAVFGRPGRPCWLNARQ